MLTMQAYCMLEFKLIFKNKYKRVTFFQLGDIGVKCF